MCCCAASYRSVIYVFLSIRMRIFISFWPLTGRSLAASSIVRENIHLVFFHSVCARPPFLFHLPHRIELRSQHLGSHSSFSLSFHLFQCKFNSTCFLLCCTSRFETRCSFYCSISRVCDGLLIILLTFTFFFGAMRNYVDILPVSARSKK